MVTWKPQEVTLKPKHSFTVFVFLSIILCSIVNADIGATRYFKLIERTYDDQTATIYRGNSVDYRSIILVKFIDSLGTEQAKRKMKIEVVRKNKMEFEIPSTIQTQITDSSIITYNNPDTNTEKSIVPKETYVDLRKWAIEPGDEIHFKISDGIERPPIMERCVPVEKHGFSGNLSFPFLSVQREGDNPGSLGAGISYTFRYIKPEKSLANDLGFGLNLSFLDFDPDQKIEIGLGFVVSFPDDILHLGAGTNLTVNQESNYYFLGINLFGIKEKLGW